MYTECKSQNRSPSWDEIRMNMCVELSRRSTCWKKKTAAIIVHQNRVISEGYNGTPKGEKHCVDVGPRDRAEHRSWSKENEVHAEMNALVLSNSRGGIPAGSVMYTVLSPCKDCAEGVLRAGISRVVFKEVYRQEVVDSLRAAGLVVEQFKKE
jgi:dCMP deaminase